MLLFVYTATRNRPVIFTRRNFKLSWNIAAPSHSNCRNFSCSSINTLTVSSGVNISYFNMKLTVNTTRTHKRLTVKISNTKKEGEKSVYPQKVKYVKQRLGWSPLWTTPPQMAKVRQEGMPRTALFSIIAFLNFSRSFSFAVGTNKKYKTLWVKAKVKSRQTQSTRIKWTVITHLLLHFYSRLRLSNGSGIRVQTSFYSLWLFMWGGKYSAFVFPFGFCRTSCVALCV